MSGGGCTRDTYLRWAADTSLHSDCGRAYGGWLDRAAGYFAARPGFAATDNLRNDTPDGKR
jgi:hypothetical protein